MVEKSWDQNEKAQLARLEREIASKDNFSEVIAHAINKHWNKVKTTHFE